MLGIDEIIQEIQLEIDKANKKDDDEMMIGSTAKKKEVKLFPRWMYANLKYKCSVTLISLLEARKDNEIVNRMMKSLNPEALKRNIVDIYFMFTEVEKSNYNPGAFNHMNLEMDGDPKTEQRASCIIETGFNLYIIYAIMQEVKLEQEGNDKQVEDEKDDENLMKMLQQSIIGKLWLLAINLIIGIHETMIEMKEMAELAMLG